MNVCGRFKEGNSGHGNSRKAANQRTGKAYIGKFEGDRVWLFPFLSLTLLWLSRAICSSRDRGRTEVGYCIRSDWAKDAIQSKEE